MPGARSHCPINLCVEIFGDRWSLLMIRDLMMRGQRTYKELRSSGEGIATNILADRLTKLEDAGILVAAPHPDDGRMQLYRLTAKGIALAPVLMEMARWALEHAGAHAPPELIALVRKNQLAREVRRRWKNSAVGPLLAGRPRPRSRRR